MTRAAAWYATVQPAWGQTASKATKSPALCWMTRAGSPLAGSVKLADPPPGTSDAGPTAVPDGSAAAAVVVVAPVPDVVEETDAVAGVAPPPVSAFDPGVLVAAPPTILPRAATSPLLTTKTPATMPATAPLDSTSRRATPLARSAAAAGRASQVSRAGAPAAPARASGVQAKKKTMSEPV